MTWATTVVPREANGTGMLSDLEVRFWTTRQVCAVLYVIKA